MGSRAHGGVSQAEQQHARGAEEEVFSEKGAAAPRSRTEPRRAWSQLQGESQPRASSTESPVALWSRRVRSMAVGLNQRLSW